MNIKRDKQEYYQKADVDLGLHVPLTQWSIPEQIAITCRILADEGHCSGLAGQITARGEEPGTMWTQRFGVGLDETKVSNLVLIDEDVNVLSGAGMPNPANRFHSYIYRARPDVNCIIHTHPPHVSALSMLDEELAVSHMDAMALYEDCAYLGEWPGVPWGDDEGIIISGALKEKRAIMLAHHGQLVACPDVQAAAILAITIERAAKLQLMARAVGPIKQVNPELGRDAQKMATKEKMYRANFEYYARGILARHPDCLN